MRSKTGTKQRGSKSKCKERKRTIDNSSVKLNQTLVAVRCTVGRYMCLHITGRKIGQHKRNEMSKYYVLVGIMITADTIPRVGVCVLFCIDVCVHQSANIK